MCRLAIRMGFPSWYSIGSNRLLNAVNSPMNLCHDQNPFTSSIFCMTQAFLDFQNTLKDLSIIILYCVQHLKFMMHIQHQKFGYQAPQLSYRKCTLEEFRQGFKKEYRTEGQDSWMMEGQVLPKTMMSQTPPAWCIRKRWKVVPAGCGSRCTPALQDPV